MTKPAIDAAFSGSRKAFHARLLAGLLTSDHDGIPAIADRDNATSVALARDVAGRIGAVTRSVKKSGTAAGKRFEDICAAFLTETFGRLTHIRPGTWRVGTANAILTKGGAGGIAQFEQYEHLAALAKLAKTSRDIRAALDIDYLIKPDILVTRAPLDDAAINAQIPLVDARVATATPLRRANGGKPILHASISCKWTIRSDRVQNARSEALNLIKNRKGKVPHIAVVTAEPLPSRIAAIALGTGEVDCVYHFALPELAQAVSIHGNDDTKESLQTMMDGKRLRDISDLPLDLAI